MKKTVIASSMAILTTTAVTAMGADCPQGYTKTKVEGSVTTMNVSDIHQMGVIDMQLTNTNKSGKVLFQETGTITGEVTKREGPVSILSHKIDFNDGSTIETVGDVATINYPTSYCSFAVGEVISNFWGTQTFKRATGEIHADGEISFPDCGNENHFELSGTVCLFKGR